MRIESHRVCVAVAFKLQIIDVDDANRTLEAFQQLFVGIDARCGYLESEANFAFAGFTTD